jgi:serine protease inhibitor
MYRRIILMASILFSLCPSFLMGAAGETQDKIHSMSSNHFAESQARFGFDLLRRLFQTSSDQNVVVSPISIAECLSMAYNGASGPTRKEMATTLQVEGMSVEELNQENKRLTEALTDVDPKIILSIANSLWADKAITFKPEFLSQNRRFFDAVVESLALHEPEAPRRINAWVSEKTKGTIREIMGEIPEEAPLVLVNAVYFKGMWKKPFNRALTRMDGFKFADGHTEDRPFMIQTGDYPYYEDAELQIIDLPYGEGRLGMRIFLPSEQMPIGSLVQAVSYEKWKEWQAKMSRGRGEIQLPRFTLEFQTELNESLKAAGMTAAFSSNADFSLMSKTRSFIGLVVHKTFMDVNEEGTEAAAATVATLKITGLAKPSEPFVMVVNRPFLLAIHDHQTKAILFLGIITNPQGKTAGVPRRTQSLSPVSQAALSHSKTLFQEGQKLYNEQRYREAIARWQELVKKSGDSSSNPWVRLALLKIGMVQSGLGRWSDAAQAFSTLSKNFPETEEGKEAAFQLVQCAFNEGKMGRAVETLATFSSRYPGDDRIGPAVKNIRSALDQQKTALSPAQDRQLQKLVEQTKSNSDFR